MTWDEVLNELIRREDGAVRRHIHDLFWRDWEREWQEIAQQERQDK